MDWKTEKPLEEGKYLVTTESAMMVDSKYGAHSYCHETDIATFIDGDWDIDGVIAWAELPDPY